MPPANRSRRPVESLENRLLLAAAPLITAGDLDPAFGANGRADMNFGGLLDYIRQAMLDKRHGIERGNALVKAEPRHLTRTR